MRCVVSAAAASALALDVLPFQIGTKAAQQVRSSRPQVAQLEEDECGISGLGNPEAALEMLEHFTNARGRAFLLLETILQTMDFVLQFRIRFLELGAIAEQLQHSLLFICLFVRGRKQSLPRKLDGIQDFHGSRAR